MTSVHHETLSPIHTLLKLVLFRIDLEKVFIGHGTVGVLKITVQQCSEDNVSHLT